MVASSVAILSFPLGQLNRLSLYARGMRDCWKMGEGKVREEKGRGGRGGVTGHVIGPFSSVALLSTIVGAPGNVG